MSLYERVSILPDFRLFIRDLCKQMELDEEDIHFLFEQDIDRTNEIMKEFAKCFVTKDMDPEYNFEIYELAGDVCVNSAVVIYLHRIIQSTQEKQFHMNPSYLPDPRLIDYFNKLKSEYISNGVFKTIANQLGMDKFLVYDRVKDKIYTPDSKSIPSMYEAFFGCFEFLMNHYIKNKYGHKYVSNFISKQMHSLSINYDPVTLYDAVTLLKETSDQTSKLGYKFEAKQSGSGPVQIIRFNLNPDSSVKDSTIVHECGIGYVTPDKNVKDVRQELSKRALYYLSDPKNGYDQSTIKKIPTMEELGISDLKK
jgi:hypothetical protein